MIISEAFSSMDITFAPFVVFSLVLFARRKYLISGICLALAILVKWIAMLMLPAFLFYFINKKGRWYRIDRFAMYKFFGGVMLIIGLLIIGFWLNHISLFSLVEALRRTFYRPNLAPPALNFIWIVTYLIKQIYPETYVGVIRNNTYLFQLISAVIFLLAGILILKNYLKRKKDIVSLLQTSLMISWSYFIWRTSIHENHLFITVLTALCLAVLNTNWSNIRLYLWLNFIGLANLVLFFGFPIREGSVLLPGSVGNIWGVNLAVLLAVFHILIYFVYLRRFLQFQYRSAAD